MNINKVTALQLKTIEEQILTALCYVLNYYVFMEQLRKPYFLSNLLQGS